VAEWQTRTVQVRVR